MQNLNATHKMLIALIIALIMSAALADEIGQVTTAPSANKTITATERLTLRYVSAIQTNGAALPSADNECKTWLSSENNHYMNLKVATTYSVNAGNERMSATSSFQSPDKKIADDVAMPLTSLGFEDKYGFAAITATHYYLFTVDKNFKNPVSTFILLNPNQDYHCAISSQSNVVNLDIVKIMDNANRR